MVNRETKHEHGSKAWLSLVIMCENRTNVGDLPKQGLNQSSSVVCLSEISRERFQTGEMR